VDVAISQDAMLRWLLVGLLFAGIGIGFQRRWVQVDIRRFANDVNMPFLADPDPLGKLFLK
jgi:hypothetical protein